MKAKSLFLFFLIMITGNSFSQISTKVEFSNAAREYLGSPKKINSIDDDELKKTSHIRYLSLEYKKAYISNSKEIYYLRYNIFSDEMEFIKGNQIHVLNKKENQIIDFFEMKKKYVVFNLDSEKSYFLLKKSGKNSILVKQVVDFEEGKKAVTQYDVNVTPKFTKRKDKLYIAFDNKNLKKIPKKKKAFYKLFGNRASEIKQYMKQNKLNHKKNDDLIKIINYLDL